jgi:hypothetical protein
MSQLRSNHRSGLAIVDSLALHQDIARILDGSPGRGHRFRGGRIADAQSRLCERREWFGLFAVFETSISQGKNLESI